MKKITFKSKKVTAKHLKFDPKLFPLAYEEQVGVVHPDTADRIAKVIKKPVSDKTVEHDSQSTREDSI